MSEGIPKQFTTPEEEIAYLREQIAKREQELLARTPEVDQSDVEAVGKQEIREYASFTPKMVLEKNHQLKDTAIAISAEQVSVASDPVEEIMQVATEKGIKNALTVLEKIDNAYLVDEVHRRLVEYIKSGVEMQDLKEGTPAWHVLHMTLYEVTLPETKSVNGREYQLAELIGMMEQLFAGLRTIGSEQSHNHFAIEIAVADNSDDIVFYVAIPNKFVTLFEKQVLSLFPHAQLILQAHDYNIFVDNGTTIVSEVSLKKHPIYPVKTHDSFASDPLSVILNAFSKIEREGGGAAVQILVRYPQKEYRKSYEGVIKNMQKGMKAGDAISRSSLGGEIMASLSDFVFSKSNKDENKEVDSDKIQLFGQKIKSDIVETNIRLAVSAREISRAEDILTEIESTFHQFSLVDGNSFTFKRVRGGSLRQAERQFSFREFSKHIILPLSLTELSTVIHLPANGIASSPQFKQSHVNTAPAPTDMPTEGTLLGINTHRNVERKIFITDEDRVRHFYIIGQTGTGKTSLMKNMIVQDIERGDGVCMIDPHGTDIEDVLSAVPKEREQDVIYFDPSRLDKIVALNMLEYDTSKPEQKTFVVNELFSIFQKLYGGNPESMGPMFEQYFRNATLLVMEDPDSGNTLMDISRVMADAKYRKMKLSKATNPVVVQFWSEIATKAGGEASLENIVPYIVSKFDVFTANDYMRPIIGQQKSAFNFRQIMDERKILLVNLSKGRLGEINANLIGMIIVGKILMAALSRVDDQTRGFPPFYLHMDEFQNVSTNSISAILSEARKYKLGLTIAHQFIAQLEPSIKDAVFGNVGSMATFRVGAEDAQFLESQFSPVFGVNDLINIPNYNAIVRILANGTPTKPFNLRTMPPAKLDPTRANALIDLSYSRYGRSREEVEAEISARYAKEPPVGLT
ncbi:MAG: type IV secretion system DNA-binding domain-containing protein [Candidatus Paceibacterota bacterium]